MPSKKRSRIIVALTILMIVIVGGFLVWWFMIRQPPVPHNIIVLSGRIEADDSTVAAKVSGRIREIRVREGDTVKAGDVIALLDEEQAAARVQQAQSAAQEAETRVTRSQEQIAVLNEQLKQANITVDRRGRTPKAACDKQKDRSLPPKRIFRRRRPGTNKRDTTLRSFRDWRARAMFPIGSANRRRQMQRRRPRSSNQQRNRSMPRAET